MYPRWTKLKTKLESFICKSLKGRIHYHLANYRKYHDQMGRAYITVDKKEVWNMCSITYEIKFFPRYEEFYGETDEDDVINMAWNQAENELHEQGQFAQWDFLECAKEFLNMSIEEALGSDNMLIKIMAILDRRVGKRTIRQMKENIESEHEIVQYFFHLRCDAEGNI